MKLTAEQQNILSALCSELGLDLVIAYGSKVNGGTHQESDLDIAVYSKNASNYDLFQKIYAGLSAIFPGENVDVRFLNDSDPLFGMQVIKQGILLHGNQSEYDHLKALINRRYVDDGRKYFPFHEQLLLEQQKKLKSLLRK